MRHGQIFTLDLFVSLSVIILVLSLTTVLIDRSIDEMYDRVYNIKMQTLAMDVASYRYYWGSTPTVSGYTVGSGTPSGENCFVSVRGTNTSEVEVYVCQ